MPDLMIGENRSPSRLSLLHLVRARFHIDGDDDGDDDQDGACDDVGRGDAGDGDEHATAATGSNALQRSVKWGRGRGPHLDTCKWFELTFRVRYHE